MTSTSILRTAGRATAALLVAGTVGTAALTTGSGTAIAPEPAKLSTSLTTSTRATAAAIFLNSQAPARVLYYWRCL